MNRLKKSLAGVALALGALCTGSHIAAADSGVLHIYNWTDYTSPEMVKKFEQDTGIKVTIDTYDSNETALAKLSSGAAGYDVIIISNDFIPIFVNQHLLQDVGVASMPNFKNLEPQYQKRSWDPEARYSVPWVWGTTSYSVNTDVYKGPTDSLKPLFEPPAELKGKIGMFGSPSEVMSLALVYLGKPQCNTDPADLKQLNALLEAQKPFVKVYNSDGTVERQVSGETVMHQQWSGKALETRQQKPAFRYVYPKEGIIGWMDNVAVPTGGAGSGERQEVPELPDGPGEHRLAAEVDGLSERGHGIEQIPAAGDREFPRVQPAGRSQDHLRAFLPGKGDARL